MDYVTRADDRCVVLRGAIVAPHPAAAVAGLVDRLADGQALLRTGVVMGPVRVAVQTLSGPPATVEDGWEDVVDVSCFVTVAPVLAVGPYADAPGPHLRLDPAGAEWFRLRVHARHRDTGFDLVATEPVEEYLLTSWPAPPAPPQVLAVGSDLARRATSVAADQPSADDGARRDAERAARTDRIRRLRGDAAPGIVESAEDAARRQAAQANLLRTTHHDER